jgi:hypothetical protein
VLQPSSANGTLELPDEFFEISSDEIKRMQTERYVIFRQIPAILERTVALTAHNIMYFVSYSDVRTVAMTAYNIMYFGSYSNVP